MIADHHQASPPLSSILVRENFTRNNNRGGARTKLCQRGIDIATHNDLSYKKERKGGHRRKISESMNVDHGFSFFNESYERIEPNE